MVPIKDNNPTQITPYVTYGLITANVLAFLYEASLPPQALNEFFHLAAVIPKELTLSFSGISVNQAVPEWATLITAQFLHGGFLHLAGNMLFLWVFGNNIEEKLGRAKYLLFYLSCGVLASLAQWFFAQDSTIPSLGASGAIAGVMGAYILRFPQVEILGVVPLGFFFPSFRVPAYFFLGFWFIQQAFYGIASLEAPTNIGMESGGIAYWAHAAGFVFGAVLGPLLGLFSDKSHEESLSG
ncbi:rhomboid family intramembrane serine protease [Nodularia spumigena]|uniref:rhomboid family intramembrane serine protease n=1 Tax=Nodularia spumigena TaxID=70799 RepID=UPI00232D2FDD|nr:rhomboid family intramembrane serine protease [Nodularia spumigena]MDB9318374.1 rhomboid family intramembrane serine protease [Nodularia spumigena CS-590/01A]MDB9328703.1 rhomboid family intramembrane serine protease [Nodularia spumigena CS-590/02]MDB9334615.1 rhomboid family intramembrane serine protease [Nodularia spumigena CS-590/01]